MEIKSLKVIDTKPSYKEVYINDSFVNKKIEYTTKTYLINGYITVSINVSSGTNETFNKILLDLLDNKKEAAPFLKENSESDLLRRIYELEEILDKNNIDY